MKAIFEESHKIEEIVFFATNAIDYFMAMVSDPANGLYLAGRATFSNGEKMLFSSTGMSRNQLRGKMVFMADQIATLYKTQWEHVVFPLGIDTKEFINRLREIGSDMPIPLSEKSLSKIFSNN